MKKIMNLCLAGLALAVMAGCQEKDEPAEKENGFKSESALKFKGILPAIGSLQLQWVSGHEIGIVPMAGDVVTVKSDVGVSAVRYTASENAPVSPFAWSDKAFVPNTDIQIHKFAAFSPYVQDGIAEGKIKYEVSAVQSGDIMQMPLYAYSEITSPIDGATVLMKFSAKAAVLTVPKIKGATKVVLSAEDGADPLCGGALYDVDTGELTVGSGGTSIEYNFDQASEDGCRVVVWPGNHENRKIHAVYTTDEGSEEVVYDGVLIEAGKSYALVGQSGSAQLSYSIDIASIDFSESYIYEAKDESGNILAVICKEYLKAANQQAIVVYGTRKGGSSMVMDSANPVGLVARVLKSAPAEDYVNYGDVPDTELVHGGMYSFNSEVMNYTAEGTSAALSVVYASYDSEAQTSTITSVADENAARATISPRVYTLADRGDTKAYKLVKVGRQIWFAENVETLKYNDATFITKAAKAADLYKTGNAAYVNTASTTNRILYNVAAATSATFIPAGTGWKIPTEGDYKNLAGYVAQSRMLTSYKVNETVVGNNITCFSITVRGRVTNNGWQNSEDSNGDPWFLCSTEAEDPIKQKCLVVRMHEAKASDAPQVNSGQNKKFGFWVRLMRGLY